RHRDQEWGALSGRLNFALNSLVSDLVKPEMKPGLTLLFVFGVAWSIFAAEPTQNEGWKVVTQSGAVTIYSRPHPGSHLKEFKATGEIDAPAETVHKVIDDVEAYASCMPYTAEASFLERKDNSYITYQRLAPK